MPFSAIHSLMFAPVVQGELTDLLKPRYDTWNALLRSHLLSFISSTPGVNVFLFSLHHSISQILDAPSAFGFTKDDVALCDGPIWEDHLHLTVEVHAIIADEVIQALFGAPFDTITRVE
jgi:phospholipase/lecithinase/hemolysin